MQRSRLPRPRVSSASTRTPSAAWSAQGRLRFYRINDAVTVATAWVISSGSWPRPRAGQNRRMRGGTWVAIPCASGRRPSGPDVRGAADAPARPPVDRPDPGRSTDRWLRKGAARGAGADPARHGDPDAPADLLAQDANADAVASCGRGAPARPCRPRPGRGSRASRRSTGRASGEGCRGGLAGVGWRSRRACRPGPCVPRAGRRDRPGRDGLVGRLGKPPGLSRGGRHPRRHRRTVGRAPRRRRGWTRAPGTGPVRGGGSPARSRSPCTWTSSGGATALQLHRADALRRIAVDIRRAGWTSTGSSPASWSTLAACSARNARAICLLRPDARPARKASRGLSAGYLARGPRAPLPALPAGAVATRRRSSRCAPGRPTRAARDRAAVVQEGFGHPRRSAAPGRRGATPRRAGHSFTNRPHPWDPEEPRRLAALASHAATAVTNAQILRPSWRAGRPSSSRSSSSAHACPA